ncbi:MAG: phosphate acyltransferase PlsX [Casimicrobiaceae bacterium]|nr:phosphate acyltransferase PlsX [Casimicrobiaceae bacterium]MDW8312820.1 phosphate acyltransferase PlsX [Burkholderiales bacterium]
MTASRCVTVAVDLDGGDHGASVTLPAAADVLRRHPELRLVLVGVPASLQEIPRHLPSELRTRIQTVTADEVVGMAEPPALALKKKKRSTMRLAVNAVKDGLAQACVSAGNTGALMATARFVLKTLPGIDRPAIASVMPTHSGEDESGDGGAVMLDLGANAQCSPEHLRQFAIMGAALASVLTGKERPTVALLNIGEEDIKGNPLVKTAAELIRETDLNFIGNVEGTDIYRGAADVVVCDGFTGNVALKASEGAAKLMAQMLKEELKRNLWTTVLATCAAPMLKRFKARVDPSRYNGASLLGLRGIVIKSHGGADRLGFANAIVRAYREVRADLITQLEARLAPYAMTSARSSEAAQASFLGAEA